jgi:hypothetical protein
LRLAADAETRGEKELRHDPRPRHAGLRQLRSCSP